MSCFWARRSFYFIFECHQPCTKSQTRSVGSHPLPCRVRSVAEGTGGRTHDGSACPGGSVEPITESSASPGGGNL